MSKLTSRLAPLAAALAVSGVALTALALAGEEEQRGQRLGAPSSNPELGRQADVPDPVRRMLEQDGVRHDNGFEVLARTEGQNVQRHMLGIAIGSRRCVILYLGDGGEEAGYNCGPASAQRALNLGRSRNATHEASGVLYGTAPRGTVRVAMTASDGSMAEVRAYDGGDNWNRASFVGAWPGNLNTVVRAYDSRGRVLAERTVPAMTWPDQ